MASKNDKKGKYSSVQKAALIILLIAALGLALSVYKAEVKREKREELLRDAGMPPIMPTSDLRRRGWRR